jgi:predicted RNase H-like nuclease
MNASSQNVWLAGVDGCPGGWIAAFVHPEGEAFAVQTYERFAEIIDSDFRPALIAVDMPIGLPEMAGHGGRAAENAVRPLLGARQSSVFSVPSRAAIMETDYAKACATALATSDPPRKVSKQLFHIAPKIREIDAVLAARPELKTRVFEVHPEVAFWRLNGEQALGEPKKIQGRIHPPGMALRQRILKNAKLSNDLLTMVPPRPAKQDDLIDACACAAIARRLHQGIARSFPEVPERDARGLPMAIWA